MFSNTTGKWIAAEQQLRKHQVCCFRKKFITSSSGSAQLKVSALGIFEARLNGKRISDEFFAPGWTDYRTCVEYRIYDTAVEAGENTLDILLADGWFAGEISAGFYQALPSIFVELTIPDGTIYSDDDWMCSSDGPIVSSDLYLGESIDSRKEWQNWHSPVIMKGNPAPVPPEGVPVRKTRRIVPVSINHGIVDFGENITGHEVINVSAKPGTKITVRHGEVLNADGSLYTENIRKAVSINTYITSGGCEMLEPIFGLHGFRYIEVSGVDNFDVTAWVMHSDMRSTCSFKCSNPLLNRLVDNIRRSWFDNAVDIPTDCPQRDERCGWLGDAGVFIRSALYLSDSSKFFRRWLKSVDSSRNEEGAYAIVAPYMEHFGDRGIAGWSDAGIICPLTIFEFTSDKSVLEDHYDAMSGYISYLEHRAENYILDNAIYGDWLNLDAPTSKPLISTAYFARSAALVGKAAAVLGKTAESERLLRLSKNIAEAFYSRFKDEFTTQTAAAMALEFDLIPQDNRKEVAAILNRLVKERNGHLSTGFLGTPLLLWALSNNGYAATAWELLEQTSYPSWLFPVINGATTVWERWNGWTAEEGFADSSMNSFNHYAYGAVLDWIMEYAAGIRPDLTIDPHPGGSLTWLEAEYRGVAIRWERFGDQIQYKIVVPKGISVRWDNEILTEGKYQRTMLKRKVEDKELAYSV